MKDYLLHDFEGIPVIGDDNIVYPNIHIFIVSCSIYCH